MARGGESTRGLIAAAAEVHSEDVNAATEILEVTDFHGLQMRPLPVGERQAVMLLLARHGWAIRRFFVNKVRRAGDVDALVTAVKKVMGTSSPWFAKYRTFASHLFAAQQVVLRRYYGLNLVEPAGRGIAAMGAASPTWQEPALACQHILTTLRALPLPQQEVLEAVYWEDLSAAELAAVLAVPIPLAASRLRAAKLALLTSMGRAPSTAAQEAAMLGSLDTWAREIGERLLSGRAPL
ncbi:MAG: hypothetical protein JNL82_13035 [Myxococcales bacterium]|nr:hypothetical protein [Myxococcales bacterium]